MISSAFQSLFGAPGGTGGSPGSGNATVPGGTSPSDPQEFVDAAVVAARGGVGVWIGTDPASPIGSYNSLPVKRLVYAPATKANGVNLLFNSCGLEEVLFPSLASITGGLFSLNTNSFTELLLPVLTTIGAGREINAWSNSLLERVEAPLLSTVDGNINIHTCPALTEVSFPSLGDFAGRISIYGNNISSLSLASGLTAFGGILEVHGNPIANLPFENLITLSGTLKCGNTTLTDPNFANLTTITGELNLSGSSNATTLGLPALVTCSGTLNLDGFGANDPLTDIGELFGIDGVNFSGGSLIASNMGLTDTGVGGTIVQLDFNLDLSSNAITSVNMTALLRIGTDVVNKTLNLANNDLSAAGAAAFPALEELWGILNLENASLENTSFSAPLLEFVASSGGLYLDGNPYSSLSLPSLTNCNGEIRAGSASLDLPALTTIGGDGSIASTGNTVTDVDLHSLESVNGTLNLNEISADVEFLVLATINGAVLLEGATGSLFQFPSLTGIDGTLSFNNSSIDIFSGGPTSVNGTLSFLGSAATSVDLPNLVTIDGLVNLSECPNLTEIGMENLTTINGELRIQSSPMDQTAMDNLVQNLYNTLVSGPGSSGFIDLTGYQNSDPFISPAWSDLTSVITVIA
jgi:hypothetical protein